MKETEQEKWKSKIIRQMGKYKGKWIKIDVVLFGISESTQTALNYIKYKGGNVRFIIDNDPIQQNRTWMGLQVYAPEYLKNYLESFVVIICGGLWYEKKQQLIRNNVPSDRIFVIKQNILFIQKAISLVKAWKIYYDLIKRYGNPILLCPYPGTGDAYLTGRYLSKYIMEHNLGRQYTILVTGRVFKKVLEMYGYSNVQVISPYECDKIKLLLSCFGEEIREIHYMLYWGLDHQSTYHIENYNNISFNEVLGETVFGANAEKVVYPQFTEDKLRIKKLVNQYKIKENRTIILAPYANSFLNELPVKWWEKLTEQMKRLGYKVFTNSSSDREAVIPGTESIFLPYGDMFPILEKSGYFVGVRSGLFDLMSSAKCKKIIIYQDFITDERMRFFSLNNMSLCNDAVELKLENTDEGRQILLGAILDELRNV